MGFDPLSWALELTGGLAIQKLLSALTPDELTRDLQSELESWAADVSIEGMSLVPEALTRHLFSEAPDDSPKRSLLRTTLLEKDLPKAELWFAALYERWEQVRNTLRREEAQSFFRLGPAEAERYIRKLALRFERACERNREMFQHSVLRHLDELKHGVRANTVTAVGSTDLRDSFTAYSKPLLKWPATLHKTGDHIKRPEFDTILTKLRDEQSSTTIVLGARGTGKSALLASIGAAAVEQQWTVFAIKADLLTETSEAEIAHKLNLEKPLEAVLTNTALVAKTVVIIDQLDAVAELLDRKTERLNFLLNLVQRLSGVANIHIVLSSREFDYRTDGRLRTTDATEVTLQPLTWEAVALVLARAGHNSEGFGEELQDLLRNAWALNIYLDVATPNEAFGSLTALLERLWFAQVTSATDAPDRERLLTLIATAMTEEEQLSAAVALADELPHALVGLLRDGILIAEETSVGFRHQTFYEFIVARNFARGQGDFLAHVFARQDGLFVRPTVFATLLYMREASSQRYATILRELIQNPLIQLHVRSLALDFAASQRMPRDVEIHIVLPLLPDVDVGPRLLRAASGSPGWFNVLRDQAAFREWMRGGRPYLTLSVLTAAVHFAEDAVLSLVEQEWLRDQRFDGLTAQILHELTSFGQHAQRMSQIISARSDMEWLIEHVANFDVPVAISLVANDLERRIPTSGEITGGTDILKKDQRSELLDELAKQAPGPFLTALWPWFAAVVNALADAPPYNLSYRHMWELEMERDFLPGNAVLDALHTATGALAESDPVAFRDFLAGAKESDVLIAHMILSDGLEVLAQSDPSFVLDYLLRDNRRLALGLEGRRHSRSAALISAIYPQLTDSNRVRLETAVKSFTMYPQRPEDDADKKKIRVRWNREHRFHLLSALPPDALPSELRRVIAEERRRFPNLEDDEPSIRGGVVGPRMRADEMERARDDDLLNLFNEITDISGDRWLGSQLDVSRAGGSGVLARELDAVVRKDPQRGVRLLPHLRPDKHLNYAAAIVTGLAHTTNADNLGMLVHDLDLRGFRSDDFRVEVASALDKRAETDGGLSDHLIEMLVDWLHAVAPTPDRESPTAGGSPQGPIIGVRQIILEVSSRQQIIGTIAEGLLSRRPAATARWLELVRGEIARVADAAFWEQVVANMIVPLNDSDVAANEILDEILAAHPRLLERRGGLWFIGLFMPRLEPRRARRWLERLRVGPHDLQKQAYGELLIRYAAWHDDDWIDGELRRCHEAADARVLIGITDASEYVWTLPRLRPVVADLLIRFAAIATQQDSAALSRFIFERAEDTSIDSDTERVVHAIAANDALLLQLASDLLTLIDPITVRHPDLAATVTRRVIDVAGPALADVTKVRGFVAAELTSIALTLHRQERYRELGLELFERMIELDLREAQGALELLDRRPTRRFSPSVARRHWRRGRRRRRR